MTASLKTVNKHAATYLERAQTQHQKNPNLKPVGFIMINPTKQSLHNRVARTKSQDKLRMKLKLKNNRNQVKEKVEICRVELLLGL